ncbi:hypothetical protein BJ742DRAFT_189190 [Cladochytrium replicatum]|nr:hypothetical protein BJ742DRAFT_189190 [Cladochytrium replicatum]
MVALTNKAPDAAYGVWDLVYFCLFNRYLQIFDIPTLLILFIDGRQWINKKITRTMVLHTLFRNIGGIIWAFTTYALQGTSMRWAFQIALPTFFWYAGELILDSYPFQKAITLAGSSELLTATCYIGFIPLILAKSAAVLFRYTFPFIAGTEENYFKYFNKFDASVILVSTWSDVLCCIVIVYVGAQNLRRRVGSRNEFVSELVKTTEMRMVACAILSISASVLMFVEGCDQDSENCQYDGARDIAINTVYSLYFLDFLILKFHNVSRSERIHKGPPVVANNGLWPNLGRFAPRRINGHERGASAGTLPSFTARSDEASSYMGHGAPGGHCTGSEFETPSFMMIRKAADKNDGDITSSSQIDPESSVIIAPEKSAWGAFQKFVPGGNSER